jgi:hypothetical protein
MYIRNYTSSLIFFVPIGTEDRRPKTETPKYQFVANYILVFFAYCQSSG